MHNWGYLSYVIHLPWFRDNLFLWIISTNMYFLTQDSYFQDVVVHGFSN